MSFRDRILDFRRVPASSLRPNPKNWREHPVEQRKALEAILREVGFAGAVLARETPEGLVLIDGHARQELLGDDPIPVLVLDVNEAEADKLLLAFDPISSLAEANVERMEALFREVQTGDEDLAQFFSDLAEDNDIVIQGSAEGRSDGSSETSEPLPPGGPQDTGIFQYNPNAFFASSNAWDIPDLLPELLAGPEDIPSVTWVKPTGDNPAPPHPEKTLFLYGANALPEPPGTKGSMLAFYVDDARFETIWTSPVEFTHFLHDQEFGSVATPDFSLWRDWPLAMQVWNIYRGRWMGRFWQESGIRIVPSLNWSDERTWEWVHAGIPIGAPLVSVQCRTTKGEEGKIYFLAGLNEAIRQLKPQNVMLYGGTQHRTWLEPQLPSGPVWHFLDSWTLVRDRLRFRLGAKK